MKEKRDSVTYLCEGSNPAKSPVYYFTYENDKGEDKTETINFRFNGTRGQYITTNPRHQDYLDGHDHLLKEGKLSRHITAELAPKDVPTHKQTIGAASVTR